MVDLSWTDSEDVLLVDDNVSAEFWGLMLVLWIPFAVSGSGKKAMPSFTCLFSPCRPLAVAEVESEAALTWKPLSIGSLRVIYACMHTLTQLD